MLCATVPVGAVCCQCDDALITYTLSSKTQSRISINPVKFPCSVNNKVYIKYIVSYYLIMCNDLTEVRVVLLQLQLTPVLRSLHWLRINERTAPERVRGIYRYARH